VSTRANRSPSRGSGGAGSGGAGAAIVPLARALVLMLALTLAAALGAGCRWRGGDMPLPAGPLLLGGRVVSASRLRHGAEVYTHYCRPCHGASGGGDGAAAPGMRPPPRDLRRGIYKFAAVAAGQLPNDDDFIRIIRGGLHGTAMLSWDVPPAELDDLIQYTKAFSPRWQTEKPGEPITPAPDPWRSGDGGGGGDGDGGGGDGDGGGGALDAQGAIARGRRVYHGLAQCAVACHPAYAPRAEIYAWTKELTRMEVREFRADLYAPVAKDSDFGFKILPPDFTFTPLRSGAGLADIYRSIAAGIGGTAMPTWKNVLPEADIWALAHYVSSLAALRGTTGADDLQRQLIDQPAWTPPPLDAGAADGDAGAGGDASATDEARR
jgi:mono/diheme cytochrome c family protein